MTINGLIDKTRLKGETVVSALKGLLFKGYVEKKEQFFILTESSNDAKNTDGTFSLINSSDLSAYSWDIQEGCHDSESSVRN